MNPTSSLTASLAMRYRIERELGAGGMATVYLARDLKHDRDVAIKVLKPDLSQTLGTERFLREIQLAAKLSHPHILPLFDSGEAGGVLFYVMPRVTGESLRDRLGQSKQLPVDEAVRIAVEVAGALDYAHRQGVVHRDVKPENIMLQDGHALVADFGIGKALSAVEGEAFTQTGMSVGTPAYMSPEQAAGDAVDGRSDLYSLGCVLYEMLVGEQPFTGPSIQAVIAKRFVQTPADVTALRDGIPRLVARALAKVLARTPLDRFETGAHLASALAVVDATSSGVQARAVDKSIAVLPFASMSADPENEYFADGITEEILNALAQIADLRVAGRTSSFSFKGKHDDLRRIGEQLNVRHVLEGSVRRSGARVRITAQLIDVRDGYHLWSERYDRQIDDVFAVQDEIASAIAERMQTTLAGAASRAQRATESIEAYEAFLKGRALLNKRGAHLMLGLACMEDALRLDPTYALAWAGIAETWAVLGMYGLASPEQARVNAGEAAAKAMTYGSDLAESHTVHAMVSLNFEWKWAEAERSFDRAVELNPGYAVGVIWHAYLFLGCARGEWERAGQQLAAWQARDQLSGYASAMLSLGLSSAGRGEEGAVWAARAYEQDPDAYISLHARQLADVTREAWPDARVTGRDTIGAPGRAPMSLMIDGIARARAGELAGARSVYDELHARGQREYVSPCMLALLAAELSDDALALRHFREAVERRDPGVILYSDQDIGRRVRLITACRDLLAETGLAAWRARA